LNVESVRAGAIWENVGAGAPRHCLAACLMTDAERYTSLTESMAPAAVVEVINRYFGALFGPVLANGGTVSDVKGDGLLAVWNHESAGPQFKARVCKACVEIVSVVDHLNKEWPAHRLPTRLGVDFGPVALASVGAHARYEYRAVGDPVNTASRLQELNKLFKTRILVSDPFAEGVSGFLFRDLGCFQLRGKRSRTRVRELVGALEDCDARQVALCREFAHAVAAFEIGAMDEALERFQALRAHSPEDGATRYYLQQLEEIARQGQEYAARRSWLSQLWRPTS
jgi:adenylate cyclase